MNKNNPGCLTSLRKRTRRFAQYSSLALSQLCLRGLLGVAVPVQIQMMTHSTWQVGLSGDADRRRDVCWPDGRRCVGGSP